MKRSFFTLLLLFALTACHTSKNPEFSNVKALTSGHFSEAQLKYLTNEDYSNTSPYNGNMSVSNPLPVKITWDAKVRGPFEVNIRNGNGLNVTYSADNNEFDFYNPLFNEDYTFTVRYENCRTEALTFNEKVTTPGPRSIRVEGVENFRDIGGWGYFENGVYKTFIKQGMLYRSGRFNEDKATTLTPSIKENGLYEIKNHLKIKTEIDLRRHSPEVNETGNNTDKSVLGDDVNYINLPMAYGGNNILTFKGALSGDSCDYNNPGEIKEFFKILSFEENYPINFHCSIGKDRTGCLAYLIEGLLGFDQETMYRDYMFTNFADAGMCKLTDITDRYGQTLDEYPNGNNLQEKIYNYLIDEIGVAKEYLDEVIRILKA